MITDNIAVFCRTAEKRSEENKTAMHLMIQNALYSNSISILRQELDLLIRVIYVLTKSQLIRESLLEQFINRDRWSLNGRVITDREMVETVNILHGWARIAYKFGCAFIHMSYIQDWQDTDPMSVIRPDEKSDLIRYINQYHSANLKEDVAFDDLKPYLLNVFEKIYGNLSYYIETLRDKKPFEYC